MATFLPYGCFHYPHFFVVSMLALMISILNIFIGKFMLEEQKWTDLYCIEQAVYMLPLNVYLFVMNPCQIDGDWGPTWWPSGADKLK